MQPEVREFKVVVLGDSGVGKTSFITRFVKRTFDDYTECTPGASYLSKTLTIDDVEVKFNIWDTAGQERYHALAKVYYRDADAVILVYDITKQISFLGLQKWMSEIRSTCGEHIAIAMVGNKEDLIEREEVDVIVAKRYAAENYAAFLKTSAKTDYGIEEVFSELMKLVKPVGARQKASPLESKQMKKKGGCCG